MISVGKFRVSKTSALEKSNPPLQRAFRKEAWCDSAGGRRRRGRLWWREEKLETRRQNVEVRKWKLGSEIAKGGGDSVRDRHKPGESPTLRNSVPSDGRTWVASVGLLP